MNRRKSYHHMIILFYFLQKQICFVSFLINLFEKIFNIFLTSTMISINRINSFLIDIWRTNIDTSGIKSKWNLSSDKMVKKSIMIGWGTNFFPLYWSFVVFVYRDKQVSIFTMRLFFEKKKIYERGHCIVYRCSEQVSFQWSKSQVSILCLSKVTLKISDAHAI